jgi:MoxR-like ATPase
MSAAQDAAWFREKFEAVRAEIAKTVVGQTETVEGVLIGLASHGHILLEGMPGLGKTLLVKSLSRAVSLDNNRIQFTPDMMPADVTGTNVLAADDSGRRFEFRPGPIFTNIVLADEINRATPKTQSAMLEAMQELAVTSGGVRHLIREPFMVMATQNPIEQEGTYALPEAQLDRFFLKILVAQPTKQEMIQVLARTTGVHTTEAVQVADRDDVLRMRQIVREVVVAEAVMAYAVDIVLATHPEGPGSSELSRRYARYGASPRGAQSLILGAKVLALRGERFNGGKEDVRRIAKRALRHRVGLNYQAEADGIDADKLVEAAVAHADAGDRDPIKV